MKLEQLQKEYKKFFEESESGRYFLEQINKLIDFNHKQAELKPDYARDHTQRAKGNREVLTHVDVILNGVKKKK